MVAKAIRDQVLALPVSDKLALVQDLWDSIAADQDAVPLSEEHAALIDERLASHEANGGAVLSWDEIKAKARSRVSENRKP
jgi:putative addiction module component (TIGR02574 family)